EYVKVCGLYGAGFYYMPGTDVCIKIGGFIRTEVNIHAAGSFSPFVGNSNAFQFRAEDDYLVRTRAALTADVREQTSYGTLRGYLAAGWQYTTDDAPTVSLPSAQATGTTTRAGFGTTSTFAGFLGGNPNVYFLRAFIQLGGWTFGKTASFYDFFNTSKYTLQTNFLYQDFGGFGVNTWGYTQQLGNGFAVTIAAQDPSPYEKPLVDLAPAGAFATSSTTTANVFNIAAASSNNNTNAGTLVPDIVASIRVDQAWGGAQIAGIARDDRATYYSNTFNGVISGSDHPNDKWGWAGMAGLELNLGNFLPWFGKADSIAFQGQYCVGSVMSCSNNSGTRFADVGWSLINVNKIGLGWEDDGYFANTKATGATGLQLTTAWNVIGAIQHYWIPEVRTSLYAGYLNYQANSSAVDTEVCQALNNGTFAANNHTDIKLVNDTRVSNTGCTDWAAWMVGTRTLWNPTKNLDVGVDVLYTTLAKTAFGGGQFAFSPGGGAGTQTLTAADTHIWAGIMRIQYNFLP
ncbi:MAG: porin, partial [Xanthobacteraceae bacterium]